MLSHCEQWQYLEHEMLSHCEQWQYLEHEMLSHCQRPYKQVVLLHIGRQTGDGTVGDGDAVDSSPAAHLDVMQRAEHQRVQERRFASTTDTHDGQQLSRMGHPADCQGKQAQNIASHLMLFI